MKLMEKDFNGPMIGAFRKGHAACLMGTTKVMCPYKNMIVGPKRYYFSRAWKAGWDYAHAENDHSRIAQPKAV